MRISPSKHSVKKSGMDLRSKKKMRRLEPKRRSWRYNLRGYKKSLKNNKMNLPKKLKKAVKILRNTRNLSMKPRLNLSCSFSITRAFSIVSSNV